MIPLYQLPSRVNIVRLKEVADEAGGPGIGSEITIYTGLCVRFTNYGGRYPNPDQQKDHGQSGKRLWKVLAQPALAVQPQDRVKVPWGTPPNAYTPLGMPQGFYPRITITAPTPATVTLDWDAATYIDSTGDYALFYTGTNWRFVDDIEAFTYDFDVSYPPNYDVTKDSSLWDFGYSVDARFGDELNYRVVQYYHAYDQCGNIHHTVLLMELECDPAGRDEELDPFWQ